MTFTEKGKLVDVPRNVERQGGARTKTIKVVCRQCNGGWMSALEEAVRPVLTPMMAGNEFALSDTQQALLARWIALKVIVADANVPQDTVMTREERSAFMTDHQLPAFLDIWIARTNGVLWSSEFHRHAATISFDRQHQPIGAKSIQCMTFGAAQFLAFAVLDRGRIGIGIEEKSKAKALQLWPAMSPPLTWPPPRTITDVEAHSMANTLDRVIASHQVKWLPRPDRV